MLGLLFTFYIPKEGELCLLNLNLIPEIMSLDWNYKDDKDHDKPALQKRLKKTRPTSLKHSFAETTYYRLKETVATFQKGPE